MTVEEMIKHLAWRTGHNQAVDDTDELVATPKEFSDPGKGGTWYTIRYALARGKKVTIIFPNGATKILDANR